MYLDRLADNLRRPYITKIFGNLVQQKYITNFFWQFGTAKIRLPKFFTYLVQPKYTYQNFLLIWYSQNTLPEFLYITKGNFVQTFLPKYTYQKYPYIMKHTLVYFTYVLKLSCW